MVDDNKEIVNIEISEHSKDKVSETNVNENNKKSKSWFRQFIDELFSVKTDIKNYENKLSDLYEELQSVKKENYEIKEMVHNVKTKIHQLDLELKQREDSEN